MNPLEDYNEPVAEDQMLGIDPEEGEQAPGAEDLQETQAEEPQEPEIDPALLDAHYEAEAIKRGFVRPEQIQQPQEGGGMPEGWEFMDAGEQALHIAQSLKAELEAERQQNAQLQQAYQAIGTVSSEIGTKFGDEAGAAVQNILAKDPTIAMAYVSGNAVANELVNAYAAMKKSGGVAQQLRQGAKPVPTSVGDQGSGGAQLSKDEQEVVAMYFKGTNPTPEQRNEFIKTLRSSK